LYLSGSPMIISSGEGEYAGTILGVPFDSTHSYRPGTRFGPDAIRAAFNNIEVFHPDLGVDLESVKVRDLGNLIHTVVPSVMVEMVRKVTSELVGSQEPLIFLGGEHLVTYGSYAAFPKDTGYVVFDAHYDLRDSYANSPLSHASYLRRVIEERGSDHIIHVGARAFAAEEAAFLKEHDISLITDRNIRDGRGPEMLADMLSTMNSIYTSFDLDVLDPAFAPGVGNPEVAGITSRELFDMLSAMQNSKIAGADIVELNPQYDSGATAVLAAKILSRILAMNL